MLEVSSSSTRSFKAKTKGRRVGMLGKGATCDTGRGVGAQEVRPLDSGNSQSPPDPTKAAGEWAAPGGWRALISSAKQADNCSVVSTRPREHWLGDGWGRGGERGPGACDSIGAL